MTLLCFKNFLAAEHKHWDIKLFIPFWVTFLPVLCWCKKSQCCQNNEQNHATAQCSIPMPCKNARFFHKSFSNDQLPNSLENLDLQLKRDWASESNIAKIIHYIMFMSIISTKPIPSPKKKYYIEVMNGMSFPKALQQFGLNPYQVPKDCVIIE